MLSSENGDNLETTTSESQMKTLKIKYIYLVIYWTQRYTMTSFFYVVSIAFHTSVPALRKYTNTSRKKILFLRAQPIVHQVGERLLHN